MDPSSAKRIESVWFSSLWWARRLAPFLQLKHLLWQKRPVIWHWLKPQIWMWFRGLLGRMILMSKNFSFNANFMAIQRVDSLDLVEVNIDHDDLAFLKLFTGVLLRNQHWLCEGINMGHLKISMLACLRYPQPPVFGQSNIRQSYLQKERGRVTKLLVSVICCVSYSKRSL